RPDFVGFLRPVTDPGVAALCVVSAIAVEKHCGSRDCV
ncbi:hypothetical protein CCL16_27265, partial [Pseudomonas syringae]